MKGHGWRNFVHGYDEETCEKKITVCVDLRISDWKVLGGDGGQHRSSHLDQGSWNRFIHNATTRFVLQHKAIDCSLICSLNISGESRRFAFVKFTSVGHAEQFVTKNYPFIYMDRQRVRIDFSRKEVKQEGTGWRCLKVRLTSLLEPQQPSW